jgi:uncharacterized cupin superfamily protein
MPAITPEQHIVEDVGADHPCGPSQARWLSEAGGLTKFGAFIEILAPGSRSSLKHWHSDEDELVFVLEGEVTLHEGDSTTPLRAGDAATFRAGVAVGHFLENRTAAPTRCLVIGTRAPVDRIHYPDHGRVCVRDRTLPNDSWTDARGNPASNPYRD